MSPVMKKKSLSFRDRLQHGSSPKLSEHTDRRPVVPQGDRERTDAAWPPIDSSASQTNSTRAGDRIAEEQEAKRINDAIDEEIERDRVERKRRRVDFRIVLLGQSESGKSTILRNFQLSFTPTTFAEETAAWRAVIELNLVRSVTYILDMLADGSTEHRIPSPEGLHGELRRLRVSLSPLRSVEETLSRFLAADDRGSLPKSGLASPVDGNARAFDVRVGRGNRWKSLFSRNQSAPSSREYLQSFDEVKNARRVIEACRDDMKALWVHPEVKSSLENQQVALHYQSGFFLDEVERIASPGYKPTSDDVLKARIQTMGVEEHILKMETSSEGGQTWLIADVGGGRHMRAAWVPYFEDVNMVLFVVATSAFDQTLDEDPTVNRLWDSLVIWKTICSSRLLESASFVLLLNKRDILDAKLQAGIQFAEHVTSYKSRPNTSEEVLTYLKGKFTSMFKQINVNKKPLRIHVTCATDSKSTAIVLAHIRQVIMAGNFESATLL